MRNPIPFALVAAWLALVSGSSNAAPAKPVILLPCQTHNEAQEEADRSLVLKLPPDPASAEAKALLPQLEAALAHAPNRPPLPEICGEQINIYDRALPSAASQADAITAYAETHPDISSKSIVRKPRMPYTFLAVYISTEKGLAHNYYGALKAADKGIANDPNDPLVVDAKASVLFTVMRYNDAIALIDAYLAAHGDDPDLQRSSHAALLDRKAQCLDKASRHAESVAARAEADKYR